MTICAKSRCPRMCATSCVCRMSGHARRCAWWGKWAFILSRSCGRPPSGAGCATITASARVARPASRGEPAPCWTRRRMPRKAWPTACGAYGVDAVTHLLYTPNTTQTLERHRGQCQAHRPDCEQGVGVVSKLDFLERMRAARAEL